MIICIVGPTGVGKTKMSVALEKKYNAIIINCLLPLPGFSSLRRKLSQGVSI